MTSDLDIYRSANELIKQHGEDAPTRDGSAVLLELISEITVAPDRGSCSFYGY